MFHLFRKKQRSPFFLHKVFVTHEAKLIALTEALKQHLERGQNVVLLYYFAESGQALKTSLKNGSIEFSEKLEDDNPCKISSVKNLLEPQLSKPNFDEVIVTELHPMAEAEAALNTFTTEKLDTTPVFYTSLDAPFYEIFGAEKLKQVMERMGVKENECLENRMISKSIQRAQQKVRKKARIEKPASSQAEWMQLNYSK